MTETHVQTLRNCGFQSSHRVPAMFLDRVQAMLEANASKALFKNVDSVLVGDLRDMAGAIDALLSAAAERDGLRRALAGKDAMLTADEVMVEIEGVASAPVMKALRLVYDGKGRDPAREMGKIADVALRDLALEPVTLYRRKVPRNEAPAYVRKVDAFSHPTREGEK